MRWNGRHHCRKKAEVEVSRHDLGLTRPGNVEDMSVLSALRRHNTDFMKLSEHADERTSSA